MLFQSTVVYTFFILVLFFLGKQYARNTYIVTKEGLIVNHRHDSIARMAFVFMLLFFSLMAGMRYDVGVDHLAYLYEYITGDNNYLERNEFLFSGISSLFYYFKIHPILYFAFLAFLQILFFLLAFKEEPFLYPYLLSFLFFTGTFSSWMNGIRQDLACCIWMFSLLFIYKKKPILYILMIIIASGFHRSASFLLLVYPLYLLFKGRFNNIKFQLLIYGGALILHQFSDYYLPYLSSVVDWYSQIISSDVFDYSEYYSLDSILESSSSRFIGNTGLGALFSSLMYLLIIVYSNKIKSFFNSPKCDFCYLLFYIGIVALTILPEGALALARPFRYFRPFYLVMLSYLLFYLLKCQNQKSGILTANLIIVAFVIMYFGTMMMSNGNAHLWYQFYFQHSDVFGIPLW